VDKPCYQHLTCATTALLLLAAASRAEEGQSLDQAANDPTASLMAVQIQNIYVGDYHNLSGET